MRYKQLLGAVLHVLYGAQQYFAAASAHCATEHLGSPPSRAVPWSLPRLLRRRNMEAAGCYLEQLWRPHSAGWPPAADAVLPALPLSAAAAKCGGSSLLPGACAGPVQLAGHLLLIPSCRPCPFPLLQQSVEAAVRHLDLVEALFSWLVTQSQRRGGGFDESGLSGMSPCLLAGLASASACKADAASRPHSELRSIRQQPAVLPQPARLPRLADEQLVDLWLTAVVTINISQAALDLQGTNRPVCLFLPAPPADEQLVDLWLTTVGVLARSLCKDEAQPLRDNAIMVLRCGHVGGLVWGRPGKGSCVGCRLAGRGGRLADSVARLASCTAVAAAHCARQQFHLPHAMSWHCILPTHRPSPGLNLGRSQPSCSRALGASEQLHLPPELWVQTLRELLVPVVAGGLEWGWFLAELVSGGVGWCEMAGTSPLPLLICLACDPALHTSRIQPEVNTRLQRASRCRFLVCPQCAQARRSWRAPNSTAVSGPQLVTLPIHPPSRLQTCRGLRAPRRAATREPRRACGSRCPCCSRRCCRWGGWIGTAWCCC